MINRAVYFYTLLSIVKGPITRTATAMFALLALTLPLSPIFDPAADLNRQVQVLSTMYILCLGVTGLAQGYRPFMDLLMTRPLSRTAFVISRWAAFSTCGLVLVAFSALLSAIVTQLLGTKNGAIDELLVLTMTIFGAGALTALFNTCLLCTTPPTFLTHTANSLLLLLVANESLATSGNSWTFWQTGDYAEPIYRTFSATHNLLLCFLPSLDLWNPWSSWSLTPAQVIVFLTPLMVSLAIASLVINKQEFSYATAE